MKKILLIIGIFLSLSCQKEEITDSGTSSTNNSQNSNTGNSQTNANAFNPAGQTLLFEGSFESAVHPTSGKAKIYEDKDKKRTLVFENFKTDAGPDLRIYLAEDKSVTNFVEVTDMVKNGDGSFVLPTSVNLSKQKHVLIWCKKFAVLFGSAQLK